MKLKLLFLLFTTVLFINGYAQDTVCKVLMESISAKYQGECKKGLAHGKGTAIGVDKYTGEFRKGYPEGKGEYRFSDGGFYIGNWKKGKMDGYGKLTLKGTSHDTTTEGYWRMGKYVGKDPYAKPYKILEQYNINRISVQEIGNQDKITIQIYNKANNREILNANCYPSSGNIITLGPDLVVENVSFPITISLLYKTYNAFKTATIDSQLKIVIEKKGQYLIAVRT